MSYGANGAALNGPVRDVDQSDGFFRDEPLDDRSRGSPERTLGDGATEENVAKVRAALVARGTFPIYAIGMSPPDSAFRTEVYRVGETVAIGNVTIEEGDFIVADVDAQVVIQKGAIRDVLGDVIEIDAGEKGCSVFCGKGG